MEKTQTKRRRRKRAHLRVRQSIVGAAVVTQIPDPIFERIFAGIMFTPWVSAAFGLFFVFTMFGWVFQPGYGYAPEH